MPGHGGKRDRAGRPPAPPTERFVVRVPVDVAVAFDEAAHARGLTRTALLHEVIRRAGEQD